MKKLTLHITCCTLFAFSIAQNYTVSTIGGTGATGFLDGACVSTAQLNWPYGLAFDKDSVIYFSDAANHSIRKISANTGLITTIAGNGTSGLVDGYGSAARFNFPDDLEYRNGFLYVGDNLNNCIRKIDLSNNLVTTIAGTGVAGYLDGPALSAQFKGGNGIGLAMDQYGNLFVADGTNAVVRKISNGVVSTVAGTPGVFGYLDGPASSAQFHRPRYMVMDTTTGDLYITDINNNVIRKLSGGIVSTFSGNGAAGATDGLWNVASFSAPVGIARTYNGYFYVVDGGGNKLRKVDPIGTVSTICGNGIFGFQDGPASSAEFYYPQDVCYDTKCRIYMADRNNNRIRRISIPEGPAPCTVGINETQTNILTAEIFPNPSATGSFYLKFNDNDFFNCQYELFDSGMRLLQKGMLSSLITEIKLTESISGILILKISDTDKTGYQKIIVNRP